MTPMVAKNRVRWRSSSCLRPRVGVGADALAKCRIARQRCLGDGGIEIDALARRPCSRIAGRLSCDSNRGDQALAIGD